MEPTLQKKTFDRKDSAQMIKICRANCTKTDGTILGVVDS